MADEKKEEGEVVKKGKGKLVIILAVVILVIGGGAGAFFAMSGSGQVDGDEAADEFDEEVEGGAHGALPPAVLPLETFIVNLQVKGSFLRTTIQLEFAEPELPHTIESDVPKIKDAIIRLLSNKSSSELLTGDGKDQLRTEIRDGVNEVLGSEEVTQVFFVEFIIQ